VKKVNATRERKGPSENMLPNKEKSTKTVFKGTRGKRREKLASARHERLGRGGKIKIGWPQVHPELRQYQHRHSAVVGERRKQNTREKKDRV